MNLSLELPINNIELVDKDDADDDTESVDSTESSVNDDSTESSVNELIEPFINNLELEDAVNLDERVYESIDEYVKEHIDKMHSSHFHQYLVQDVTIEIFELLLDIELCIDQDPNQSQDNNPTQDHSHYQELQEFVEQHVAIYFDTIIDTPYRQVDRPISLPTIDIAKIALQIDTLRAIPQPVQRTKPWYEYRYNLITASNLGKLFSTESQYNALICEKCKPLDYASSLGHCGTESSMHWGTKYEPITIMLYEKLYDTKIEDFGCIRHSTYPCIGASPDGINVDPTSNRYGRMLEVKNIVNRDITGIPLDAYWIQMQIQMETCNLDLCDFAETRFKEYEEAEFYQDLRETKGVILYFVKKTARLFNNNGTYNSYNVPHYVYMPLSVDLSKESVEKWTADKKEELKTEYTLYTVQYWYLDQFSCVLVQRNRDWFRLAVGKIEEAWRTVERERISGWEHRLPKKKQNHSVSQPIIVSSNGLGDDTSIKQIKNLPITNNLCLIKLE